MLFVDYKCLKLCVSDMWLLTGYKTKYLVNYSNKSKYLLHIRIELRETLKQNDEKIKQIYYPFRQY